MSARRRRPPVLSWSVTGVFVRHIRRMCCPCTFAVVRADFEPWPDDGTGGSLAFVDDLPETCGHPGEPLPEDFVRTFAKGAREAWEDADDGRPLFAARVVLRDALSHEVDSNPQSFQVAGRLAARETLCCVAEGRGPRPAGRSGRSDGPVPPMPRTLRSPGGSPPA